MNPRKPFPLSASESLRQRPLAPDPAAPIPAVHIATSGWHPSVYRKRIKKVEKARPGDLVAVYGPGDQLLGYGLYNPRSEIAVRMLFYGPELPDDALWQKRLEEAVRLRKDLLRLDAVTDAYRVVHAEADGLPGLVVDRLGEVLSAEVYSLGMYQRAEAILERLARLALAELASKGTVPFSLTRKSGQSPLTPGLALTPGPALTPGYPLVGASPKGRGEKEATLVRPSPQFLSQEGHQPPEIRSPGLPDEVTVREFGTRFRVRFTGGHKTGFFCDQRENRKRLSEFCEGRTVLDLCCYTGGFAVQAKCLGRAAEVTGVDLDEGPLELAKENANLNQVRIRFVQADAFDYMREMLRQDRRYDVVVLDPPKLIRSRAELEEGTRKHFDLNRLAMRLVAPGGLFLSCCCAGLLKEDAFLGLLRSAACQAGPLVSPATDEASERHAARPMQILARTGAAADHPVAANVPETEYLKAVWMRLG
ncbi:MAG: class I SAM-dependent rRNA methyltransferase [Thermoguttaceae bacterium]